MVIWEHEKQQSVLDNKLPEKATIVAMVRKVMDQLFAFVSFVWCKLIQL